MKKKKRPPARRNTPKKENAEEVARMLGVSPSAVYGWRSTGHLPKNPRIRADFLRLEGRTK